jgi:hypothetical protein
MIQASELRKGSKVLFAVQGRRRNEIKPRICTVKEIHELTALVDDMGLPLSLFFTSDDLQPIPLTPEILIACGFTYMKIEGVASLDEDNPKREENTHNWTLNIKRQGIYDGKGRLELVKWGDGPKEKIWFSDQWLRVEMKSLHQLQNLYFSLTNTELNYLP